MTTVANVLERARGELQAIELFETEGGVQSIAECCNDARVAIDSTIILHIGMGGVTARRRANANSFRIDSIPDRNSLGFRGA